MTELKKLTENFTQNMWSRMTMYRSNPTKITKNTPLFKQVISLIELNYPGVDFIEACFWIRNNIQRSPKCPVCSSKLKFRSGNTKEPYSKYCSNTCKSKGQANPAADSISINGIVYRDFISAMSATGENRATIRDKIFDSSIDSYHWTNNHTQTCIEKIKSYSPILIDKDVLVSWIQSKRSLSSIEREYNISRGQISNAYKFFGLTHIYEQINPDAIIIRDNKDLLEQMYQTLTTEEIAGAIGVTPKSVQNWLKDHNIEIDYSKSQSKIEREIIDYIKLISQTKILDRDRTAIELELDIYLPNKKVAFEFNGLFYHSTNPTNKTNITRHAIKRDLCYKNGITLLQFTDVNQTSDAHKLDIVKSMISNKVNGNNITKFFARKTEIRLVEKSEAIDFFNQNHISGHRGCELAYGLYYNGILVCCMSFGSPINNKKYDWEIVRFASKKFTRVVGGASKIFSRFVKHHSGTVITYVDNQHGNGETYKKIGMTFIRKTDPGYFYTDMKRVYSRYEFQYPAILKHCKIYDSEKTELENAEANGFNIYWNAGNLVYEYIPS